MLSKLENVDNNNSDEVTNIFKNKMELAIDKLNEQMVDNESTLIKYFITI